MAKYLVQVKYTTEGLKGVIKDGGSKRREAAETVLSSVGGKLESLYFAFGETDLFAICEMPDNVTASALALILSSSGFITTTVTVLVTPEEIDAAVKMTADYRPPGK